MSNEKMWNEFKEWHDRLTDLDAKLDEYGTAYSADGASDGSLICNTATNGMWQAWKASRAALCVELPKLEEPSGVIVIGFNVAKGMFIAKFMELGVRYR